jgi:hypothetical protein
MKRLTLCLCMLFTIALPSYAVPYDATGMVYFLRVHDSTIGPDIDWFAITGVSSLGNCQTNSGQVVLMIRDDQKGQRMFTLVLAAKTSGTPLTVSVDDTVVDPYGYCFVRSVQ